MNISLFLGKFFGLYFVIIGFFYIVKKAQIKKMVAELFENISLLAVTGALSLIIGLLTILAHNVWIWDWPLLITLIGYLALIKGLIRLFAPMKISKKWITKLSRGHGLTYVGIVCLIIGSVLISGSFFP